MRRQLVLDTVPRKSLFKRATSGDREAVEGKGLPAREGRT